jgi:hypothetical protein
MPCPATTRVPCQKRLVDRDVDPSAQPTVRGDAVSLGEDDEVASHHVAPCDATMRAIADDEGPGARQIAQRLQRPLRAPLLDDGDRHDHEHEAEEHQGVGWLAHEEVQAPRGYQHDEHGLASDFQADREQAPFLLGGQLVRSILLQACTSILFAEPDVPAEGENAAGDASLLLHGHLAVIPALIARDSSGDGQP